MKKKRLEYIDILRSIAIIMMLEGHFMTLSLQSVFRDNQNPIYELWKFSRGLTAPLFLCISGLIFTYLLLSNKVQGWHNPRVKKGIKRISLLVLLGYLLQVNLNSFFFRDRPLLTSLTQIFHILQCIGTSLFILIILYLLKIYILKIPFGILLLSLGIFVIIFSPTLHEANFSNFPRMIENIFIISKNKTLERSVFPLFPWAGYVFLGGSLGTLITILKDYAHHYLFPVTLILVGLLCKHLIYFVLESLQLLPLFNTLEPFQYQYEPVRFCQILVFIGVVILAHKIIVYASKNITFRMNKTTIYTLLGICFSVGSYLFTKEIKTTNQTLTAYLLFFSPIVITLWLTTRCNYNTFLTIGQNTLSVYVFHVVILYRGFFGFKLGGFFKDQLTPFYAITGAIIFVFFFLAYTQYTPILMNKIYRLSRK